MKLKGTHAGQPTLRLALDPATKAFKCFLAIALALLLVPVGAWSFDNVYRAFAANGDSPQVEIELVGGTVATVEGDSETAYFKEAPTLKVTVTTDGEFDAEASKVVAAVDDTVADSEWKLDEQTAEGAQKTWVYEAKLFDAIGNSIYVTVVDSIESGEPAGSEVEQDSTTRYTYVVYGSADSFAEETGFGSAEVQAGSKPFTIDSAAPTVEMRVIPEALNSNDDDATAKYYGSEVTVSLEAADELFDSSATSVTDNDTPLTPQPTWTETSEGVWSATVTVPVDENTHNIAVAAQDKLDNSASKETGDFAFDAAAPMVDLSLTGVQHDGTDYYTSDVTVNAIAEIAGTYGIDEAASGVWVSRGSVEEEKLAWSSDSASDGLYTVSKELTEDGLYEVRAAMVKETGQSAEKTQSFIIDKTAPQVDVVYDSEPSSTDGSDDSAINYYQGSVTGYLSVEEANLESVNAKDVITNESITLSSATESYTFTVSGDGHHKIEATATDKAGHTTTVQFDEFVIDETAPNISLAFDKTLANSVTSPVSTIMNSGDSYDSIEFFAADGQNTGTLTIVVEDANISADSIEVQSEASSGDKLGNVEWKQDETNPSTYTATLTCKDSVAYGITVTARDKASNETSWAYGDGTNVSGVSAIDANGKPIGGAGKNQLVYDVTSPNVTVKMLDAPTNSVNGVDYYTFTEDGGSLKFWVIVDDPYFAYANVSLNDEPVVADSFEAGSYDETTGEWATDMSASSGQWRAVFSVDASSLKDSLENGNTLTVAAYDMSGNLTKYEYGNNDAKRSTVDKGGAAVDGSSFVVDAKAPKFEVSFDNNDVSCGKYYDVERTATIKVTEPNFDEGRVVIDTTGTVGEWVTDGEVHTVVVSFADDGVHYLNLAGEDLAGNEFGPYESGDFAIDKTKPELDVAFDNNDVRHDKYYAAGRTATITVAERNFDSSLIQITTNGMVGEWSSEGDARTIEVAFLEEETYSLSVAGVDLAGNPLEPYETDEFVVDFTQPVLEVSYDNNDVRNGRYYNASRTATVMVTELNFDPEHIEVDTNGEIGDWVADSVDPTIHRVTVGFLDDGECRLAVNGMDLAENAFLDPYDSGNFVVDTVAPAVDFFVDQLSATPFSSEDYFNNSATGADELSITVNVRDVNFESGSVVKSDGTVVGETRVLPSGVYSLEGSAWTQGADNSDSWTYEVRFGENVWDEAGETADSGLEVTVYDKAGNATTYAYGDDGNTSYADEAGALQALKGSSFVVDLTAPGVSPLRAEDIPDRDYANAYDDNAYLFMDEQTTMAIEVFDDLGLYEVTLDGGNANEGYPYYIKNDERAAGDRKRIVEVALRDGYEFDRDIVLHTADIAGNIRVWNISPTGEVQDVTESSDANTPLYGDQTDVYPDRVIQDTVAPSIWFEGADEGEYYTGTRTLTLQVNELNFRYLKRYDASQQVVTITRHEGNASRAESSWVIPVARFVANNGDQAIEGLDGLYSYSEVLTEDGHYTLSAELTDPAGHSATATQGEFTIDNTAPTISVAFDNNASLNERYFDAGRTATITITEHNFDASLIDIQTNGAVGRWTHNGDTHTIQVGFMTDGVYNLSVSGRDLAGNELAPYTADEFVVDLTAPTIVFSGVEDHQAYNDAVLPVITFGDEANFDASSVTYTLTGNRAGVVEYASATSQGDNSTTVSYEDFQRIISVDDVYTITASVNDLAGNTYEDTITFSVNRFGSNFIIEDPRADGADSADLGYLAEAPQLVIREINVTGIEESNVAVTYNLKTTNLQRVDTLGQPGYTVVDESSANGYGWQEYVYTIARESFEAKSENESTDGNYVVVVSSTDATGNMNSSANFWVDANDERVQAVSETQETESAASDAEKASAETSTVENAANEATGTETQMSAAVKFTLDTTKPELIGLNVEDGGVYNNAGSFGVEFTATDNIGFDANQGVTITVDGKNVNYTIDDNGLVSFSVEERPFQYQDLKIEVVDYAGNSSADASEDGGEDLGVRVASGVLFKVTSNIFDLYAPFLIAGGVVILVAAGAGAYVYVRRKRKSAGDDSATSSAA